MMTRTIVLLLLVAAVVLPAASAPARTPPAGAIAFHLSGGMIGADDWVVVKRDGTVVAADRSGERVVRRLSKAERAQLAQAFEAAGFFRWQSTYGGPVVPDGQTRTLSFDDGKRKKSVSWVDPGTPPAGFQALMKRMEELGRK